MNRRGRFVFVRVCLCLFVSHLLSFPVQAGSENDYFRALVKKPIATKEDLARVVARFKGYRGPASGDVAPELQYLLDHGVQFRKNAMRVIREPVTKADAVLLFLNAMDAAADQRGVMGRLFPRSLRFAARDGKAQRLLPADSYIREYLSGAELLAMLGRAIEQREKKR
ncbi:MAG: hypothetical protein A3G34_03575 [Candidatus Lindowbacteria bacterium RIFCSPLOWO2_12_FULL_62_27]|nr:MAG: hypothetical protein A3I06_13230 [Candidatus Lindowbacteria bacterium RIFCSPLOWO2_02_FULL_62_12]OGH60514.1 MAG: hypothetical protein A3G34_03575 [Candidatus Lindowbacteria bacterium RIFCSPLOWO2_12_FULL_62_27]